MDLRALRLSRKRALSLTSIASKLLWLNVFGTPRSVGASLLAKAVCQAEVMLNLAASSRASLAPTEGGGVFGT
jgi:hypothetical protein